MPATPAQVDAEEAAIRAVGAAACPLHVVLERVVVTPGGAVLACWQVGCAGWVVGCICCMPCVCACSFAACALPVGPRRQGVKRVCIRSAPVVTMPDGNRRWRAALT